jgi:hypothetical protein
MDACARSEVDRRGKLSCALQHLDDRSRAVLQHHSVHGGTCQI